MSPLVLLAPCLLAGVDVGYLVGMRAEAVARNVYAGDSSSAGVTADLDLNPAAGLLLADGRYRFTAGYSPRLLIREPYNPTTRPDLMHRGTLGLDVRLSERHRLFADEFIAYGTTDYTTLVLAQNPDNPLVVEPVPTVRSIAYLQSETSAGGSFAVGHSSGFTLRAGYSVSGGADRAAQEQIPLQRGPRLLASLRISATDADELTSLLSAAHSDFSTGRQASLVELSEDWRHRFDTRTDAELALGISAARSAAAPGATPEYDLLPVARASAGRRYHVAYGLLDTRLGASMVPFIDRFQGAVYERAEGALTLAWSRDRHVSALVRAGVAAALDSQVRSQVAAALEAGLGYQLSGRWRIEGAYRAGWAHQRAVISLDPDRPSLPESVDFQWSATLAVTFRESSGML